MRPRTHFSSEEIHELQKALATLSKSTHRDLSLNELLQGWNQFVSMVERGYKESVYDYTNDLSVRDLLESLLLNVPASVRDKISALLEPYDLRFQAATSPTGQPLLRGLEDPRSWWFRIPKVLGPELEDDLRAQGIA
ncbi:MAG: hypothetical protein ACREBG_19835 [Pyrinomonadaceae bacterium]